MTCVVLLWLTCFSWIITFSLARYAWNRQQALNDLLKVARQIQERADYWKQQHDRVWERSSMKAPVSAPASMGLLAGGNRKGP